MSLVGFTRLGSLTAPSVTGSAADLPTLVKFEDFTSTMLASLDVGGGDLRFSSDLAGATQLACEVVTFTKATGDVVWVKVPSVSTGALIYVWGDNTGATQPAVGAAFGRNAVWSDFEVNYHFNSVGILIDATGNHDLTQFGSPTSVTGQVGDAVTCTGSYSNRFEAVGYKGIAGNSARTVTLWSNSSASQDRGITTWGASGTGLRWSVWLDSGRLRTEISGSYKYTNAAVSDATFKRLSSVYDGTTFPAGLTHRTNGTTDVGYVAGSTVTVNTGSTTDLIVAAQTNLATTTVGSNQTDEFAIRAFALSQEQDLIEYDNQSATGAWWTAADAPSGGAIELTPTTINSNSQSFNPTLQYASLLNLTPGVVNSASSTLNPVIQYSASLLIAPSVVDSASSSLNPALQYASVVLLEPATVNSSSSALNPNISFSAALNIFPNTVDSSSISLDPVVNYTSILNISPSVANSNSVSFNPSIDYTSALILSPVTVNSSSVSLDPLVEYKAVINITSQLINSASVSLNPSISTGATQDVGLVSAGFANDLYSVQYEASGVTASYQLSNISVNFKG